MNEDQSCTDNYCNGCNAVCSGEADGEVQDTDTNEQDTDSNGSGNDGNTDNNSQQQRSNGAMATMFDTQSGEIGLLHINCNPRSGAAGVGDMHCVLCL